MSMEFKGEASCQCPYCKRRFIQEVVIDVELPDCDERS
jgi:hypothetical protein